MGSWKLELQRYQPRPRSNIPSCLGDLINSDAMICRWGILQYLCNIV